MTDGMAGAPGRADGRAADPEDRAVDAAIFDMDGVVTDTARAHFAAWKAVLEEVLAGPAGGVAGEARTFGEDDYFAHVDGLPRLEGVRRFLAARGIALPEGEPSDAGLATVHGIGNAKNARFLAFLARERVAIFRDAAALVAALKRDRIPVGVFSASRNAAAVLESAGILDHFDVRLDGSDASAADLPGKPDPAMLVETARRLGAAPERTMVVEDAVAGVAAAALGRFRWVVGIDRSADPDGAHGAALRSNGADIVTRDLRRLVTVAGRLRQVNRLPDALDHADEILARAEGRPLAVLLDYDGTLSPIVPDFRAAVISDAMRAAVERLAARARVAVVSGRDAEDVRARVGLDGIAYAGSHGFDIRLADGSAREAEGAAAFLPALDGAEARLREGAAAIPGAEIDRKRFDVTLHHRRVADADRLAVERLADAVEAAFPTLRRTRGKMVVQFQPKLAWDKGRAVRWLLAETPLGADGALPVYLGDDVTDEDAFAALPAPGVGIAVGAAANLTTADFALADVERVRCFLEAIAAAV